MIIVTRECFDQ